MVIRGNIYKFDPVFYTENGIIEPGRILDVKLTEGGLKIYVENLLTHSMIMKPLSDVQMGHRRVKEEDKAYRLTREEYIEDVKCGYITDYDGSGYWGNENYMFIPCEAYKDSLDYELERTIHFLYVYWFNR